MIIPFRHLPLTALLVLLISCQDKEQETIYPNIITELADIRTDGNGMFQTITTDQGNVYRITNPKAGYAPKALYRLLCGYVPEQDKATIYQLQTVWVLRDSTHHHAVAKEPTSVLSVWRAGNYINMHLAPLTQGGKQYWGFITDSIKGDSTFISLYHRQNNDPLSYTQTMYASLPLDSLRQTGKGDNIVFRIQTFKGEKKWNFKK